MFMTSVPVLRNACLAIKVSAFYKTKPNQTRFGAVTWIKISWEAKTPVYSSSYPMHRTATAPLGCCDCTGSILRCGTSAHNVEQILKEKKHTVQAQWLTKMRDYSSKQAGQKKHHRIRILSSPNRASLEQMCAKSLTSLSDQNTKLNWRLLQATRFKSYPDFPYH